MSYTLEGLKLFGTYLCPQSLMIVKSYHNDKTIHVKSCDCTYKSNLHKTCRDTRSVNQPVSYTLSKHGVFYLSN